MSTSKHPKAARTTAFACYVAFRHADRAHQRGQMSDPGHAAANEALRAQVMRVWQQIFPGQEGAAYSWVLERLRLLEAENVLPPEAARRIREAAAPKASPDVTPVWGALALLWRIHVLYLLVVDISDRGELPATALPRLKEVMHSLALSALNREVKNAEPGGAQLLHEVVQEARTIVRSLIDEKRLPAPDGENLLASLGGIGPGAGPPASISADAGTCLVCGEGLSARAVVYCGACETPHHPDCWSYNGRCAMFACGCVEAAPRPGATPAPRFDLDRPVPTNRPPPPPPAARSGGSPLEAFLIFAVLFAALVLATIF